MSSPNIFRVLFRSHAAGILAKIVLLKVCSAKDRVSDNVQRDESEYLQQGQFMRMVNEIQRLQRVRERHPDKIAPAQHPSEVFVLDVPCRENSLFMKVVVGDIKKMKRADQNHRRRYRTVQLVLLRRERKIHQDP